VTGGGVVILDGERSGATASQMSIAKGQRQAKRQPRNSISGSGGVPGIEIGSLSAPSTGIEFLRPSVYGWNGLATTSRVRPLSTMTPEYITAMLR
jgi:hypothetical protein